MEVLFDETRIPVVYYGPINTFQIDDKLFIEGVYISEVNGIAAQRVEQIAANKPIPPTEETQILLKVTLIVILWTLLCASIFLWKKNLKRWWQANPILFSSTSILLPLLPAIILLSSCTVDLSTTLKKDGSGTTSILVHESSENLDFLRSAPGISGYMYAVINQVKDSGALFEQYIEGDQEVIFLQRDINNSGSGYGNTYPMEGSWTYVQEYQEGNEEILRFIGVIDTRTLYNNENLASDVAGALSDELDQINMTYHLAVPGKLVYSNGMEETNGQVSWQIRMNDINYLVAETRFPKEDRADLSSNSRVLVIILALIFILSTLFLIVSIWIRPTSNPVRGKV
jgi:hypothetical protein